MPEKVIASQSDSGVILTPPCTHGLRSLQNYLDGRKLANVEAIKTDIETYIASKPDKFFKEGIEELTDRWKKVIINNGEYILD